MPSTVSTFDRYARAARRRLARLAKRVAVSLDPAVVQRPDRPAASTPGAHSTPGSDRTPGSDSTIESEGAILLSLAQPRNKDALVLVIGEDIGSFLDALVAAGFNRIEALVPDTAAADALAKSGPEPSPVTVRDGALREMLATYGDDAASTAICVLAVGVHERAADAELARVASRIVAIVPADLRYRVVADFGAVGMSPEGTRDWPPVGGGRLAGCVVHDFRRMDKRSTLYDFWRQPAPEGNNPAGYVSRTGRSEALAEVISDLPHDARILEIGCNVGRNLAYLYDLGYHRVEGIEINPNAIAMLRNTFPQLAGTTVHEGAAGDHLPRFATDEFDLIFTMAVIEHLHPEEAEVVFDHMVRVGEEIVAVEPMPRLSHRQFPHDVPAAFAARGLTMRFSRPMSDFASNADDQAMTAFTAWRFSRRPVLGPGLEGEPGAADSDIHTRVTPQA